MTTAAPIPAPAPMPHQAAPVVRTVVAAPAWRVFELDQGAGVVVFREVNGRWPASFTGRPWSNFLWP